jgi:hypothetical protein
VSGLNHDFQVIDTDSFSLKKQKEYMKDKKVELHDDFLCYISDSIKWIKSFNPARKEVTTGLCWNGPTIISFQNIKKFEKIIMAWITLFENAPSKIHLCGSYGWIEGEPIERGSYQNLIFEKKEILKKLEVLVSLCKIVINDKGKTCLLHYGI